MSSPFPHCVINRRPLWFKSPMVTGKDACVTSVPFSGRDICEPIMLNNRGVPSSSNTKINNISKYWNQINFYMIYFRLMASHWYEWQIY